MSLHHPVILRAPSRMARDVVAEEPWSLVKGHHAQKQSKKGPCYLSGIAVRNRKRLEMSA
jgi:hypothetical protein